MPNPPTRVLVLGLGNDILTDDAVGLHVARAVSEQLKDERDIEVKATTEMGLALLDEIAGRAAVVLVDSMQTGRAPAGHVHEIDAATLASVSSTAPHMLGVGETLSLGRMLGLSMPRQVRAFAVEVADPYRLGTELSPPVRAAVGPAAARVVAAARELSAAGREPSRRHGPGAGTDDGHAGGPVGAAVDPGRPRRRQGHSRHPAHPPGRRDTV